MAHQSTYQGIVSYEIKMQLSKSTFVKLSLNAMALNTLVLESCECMHLRLVVFVKYPSCA